MALVTADVERVRHVVDVIGKGHGGHVHVTAVLVDLIGGGLNQRGITKPLCLIQDCLNYDFVCAAERRNAAMNAMLTLDYHFL